MNNAVSLESYIFIITHINGINIYCVDKQQ